MVDIIAGQQLVLIPYSLHIYLVSLLLGRNLLWKCDSLTVELGVSGGEGENIGGTSMSASSNRVSILPSPPLIEAISKGSSRVSRSYFPPLQDPKVRCRPSDLPPFIKPLESAISEIDLDYLIKKGVFYLPHEPVARDVVRAYLNFVPFMPILDDEEFLNACNGKVVADDDRRDTRISLLLYQAVMFVGSAVSPQQCGQGSQVLHRVLTAETVRRYGVLGGPGIQIAKDSSRSLLLADTGAL